MHQSSAARPRRITLERVIMPPLGGAMGPASDSAAVEARQAVWDEAGSPLGGPARRWDGRPAGIPLTSIRPGFRLWWVQVHSDESHSGPPSIHLIATHNPGGRMNRTSR